MKTTPKRPPSYSTNTQEVCSLPPCPSLLFEARSHLVAPVQLAVVDGEPGPVQSHAPLGARGPHEGKGAQVGDARVDALQLERIPVVGTSQSRKNKKKNNCAQCYRGKAPRYSRSGKTCGNRILLPQVPQGPTRLTAGSRIPTRGLFPGLRSVAAPRDR